MDIEAAIAHHHRHEDTYREAIKVIAASPKSAAIGIKAIVAVDSQGVIGIDGELPWHSKEDMRYFRAQTAYTSVIMGRKTADSLPGPLKDRHVNVVLTRNAEWAREGFITASTPQEALAVAAKHANYWMDEVVVIGGAEIYDLFSQVTGSLHLTRMNLKVDTFGKIADYFPAESFQIPLNTCDAHYPPLTHHSLWRLEHFKQMQDEVGWIADYSRTPPQSLLDFLRS